MGTWGTGLFSDDRALAIRDHYRELLEDGVEDGAATRQTLEKFGPYLEEPDSVALIAFAVTLSGWHCRCHYVDRDDCTTIPSNDPRHHLDASAASIGSSRAGSGRHGLMGCASRGAGTPERRRTALQNCNCAPNLMYLACRMFNGLSHAVVVGE